MAAGKLGGGVSISSRTRFSPVTVAGQILEHGVRGPAGLRRQRYGLLRKVQRGFGAALGASLLVETGERGDGSLLVGDQRAVMLAGRLHVAERQIRTGF